jgi:CRISPR-associated protein Csx10
MRVDLLIDLVDDVVLSERNATEGAHRSLDHIPGSALLGLAATRLYPRLSPSEAFLLFHSGRVRFGAAFPVGPGDCAAYPVPLCWHARKNDAPRPGMRLDPTRVANCAQGGELMDGDSRAPMKQLREVFVCDDGWVVVPRKTRTVKTAIDSTTRRAADAQLFGYEALAGGQRFRASIEAGDEVPADLFEQVVAALVGDRFLGRSRSAEFGRVHISRAAGQESVPIAEAGTEAALWCLSDLHAVDSLGMSTPRPEAGEIGFPGAMIDWSRSFVRTRRFSPWNAHRGGYEVERVVLAQGSVLWLTNLQAGTLAGQRVVGASRESGYGHCWLAPPLLAGKHPVLAQALSLRQREPVAGPKTNSPLVDWLQRQADRRAAGKYAAARAQELASRIAGWYGQARMDLGRTDDQPVGPSASQWRDVAELIDHMAGGSPLDQVLFLDGNAPCRENRPGWSDRFWSRDRMTSFREAFRDLVHGEASGGHPRDTLVLLARRAAELAGGRDASRTRSSAGGDA